MITWPLHYQGWRKPQLTQHTVIQHLICSLQNLLTNKSRLFPIIKSNCTREVHKNWRKVSQINRRYMRHGKSTRREPLPQLSLHPLSRPQRARKESWKWSTGIMSTLMHLAQGGRYSVKHGFTILNLGGWCMVYLKRISPRHSKELRTEFWMQG